MRLTKIYTRTGDDGHTNWGKTRIAKDESILEVLGTIDELNSCIGLILAYPGYNAAIISCLTQIQHTLFDLGGELFTPEHPVITQAKVTELENALDTWNATLPPLQEFLLPRGDLPTATCHLARTICRRAERCLVHVHRQTPFQNLNLLSYLNRLSDLLFVIARVLGREAGQKETLWKE